MFLFNFLFYDQNTRHVYKVKFTFRFMINILFLIKKTTNFLKIGFKIYIKIFLSKEKDNLTVDLMNLRSGKRNPERATVFSLRYIGSPW